MDIVEILLWLFLGLFATFYLIYYALMVHESKKPNNVLREKKIFEVTLLIPTYNEARVIRRKLLNVESLDYPQKNLEVIIIDSASGDDTLRLVQHCIDKSKIRYKLISQPERLGKASAINYAVPYCRGDIIVMTDADALFKKDALKKIVENFSDPTVGAATGRMCILNADQSLVTKLEKSYRTIFEIIRRGESNMDSTTIFNGPITAFRKELFDELEPDTVTDDIEICIRIRKKGYRSVYDPEAIAYENTPISRKSRIKQKTRRAHGAIQSIIRHKGLLFNRKYGKYGFIIFPSEFFMQLISPFMLFFIILLGGVVALRGVSSTLLLTIVIIFLVGAMVLFSFILQTLKRDRRLAINPVKVLFTFFDNQLCLFLGFVALLMRKRDYKWEKIEDVRLITNGDIT